MLVLKLQRVLTVAASLMVVLASASAQSPPFIYLFDLFKQPTFHRSFDQLFDGQPNVDDWIRVFQKTNNGVASPIEPRQIGQSAYILAEVCKPHDCGNNMLRVLFTKDGTQATAVLITPRGQRWFAAPNAAERQQLLK